MLAYSLLKRFFAPHTASSCSYALLYIGVLKHEKYNLPRETRLRMADLANHKERKGLTGLSENSIRRLMREGKFPQPHEIEGVKGKFYVYGEVLDWLQAQQTGGSHE